MPRQLRRIRKAGLPAAVAAAAAEMRAWRGAAGAPPSSRQRVHSAPGCGRTGMLPASASSCSRMWQGVTLTLGSVPGRMAAVPPVGARCGAATTRLSKSSHGWAVTCSKPPRRGVVLAGACFDQSDQARLQHRHQADSCPHMCLAGRPPLPGARCARPGMQRRARHQSRQAGMTGAQTRNRGTSASSCTILKLVSQLSVHIQRVEGAWAPTGGSMSE